MLAQIGQSHPFVWLIEIERMRLVTLMDIERMRLVKISKRMDVIGSLYREHSPDRSDTQIREAFQIFLNLYYLVFPRNTCWSARSSNFFPN